MRAYPLEQENQIQKYRFVYHFIPHKYHKKRARLLSHGALISYSLVLLVFAVVIRFLPIFAPGVLGYASNIEVNELLRYTNERRARVGLRPLSLNADLTEAAFRKANDMFQVDYWAHVSPTGAKPWDFILGEGYDYIYAGENLAKNFSTSEEVVQAWYDSPTHRENLLSANYDDIGFAIVNGVLNGYETTLVVQMFGRLREPRQIAAVNEISEGFPSTQVAITQPEPVESAPKVEGRSNPVLPQITQVEQTKSFVDVRAVTQSITIAFGGFVTTLLSIDIWYSKRHGILKLTGHTLAHLAFLLVALASVMLSVFPGTIL